jgi:hypothetical protein
MSGCEVGSKVFKMANNMGSKTAMVNFGGVQAAGQEYVYSLEDIKITPNVIQYPKNLAFDAAWSKRTVESLSPAEKTVFDNTPEEPMLDRNKQPVLAKKGENAGKPVMKPKAQDEIQFVFSADETGTRTGTFDFAFRCYPGFKPQKDFDAFLLATKGIDRSALSGNKNLWDLYFVGEKFVIATKPELKDGKYAQIDTSTIHPFAEGMTLGRAITKDQVAASSVEADTKLLEFLKGKTLNPLKVVEVAKSGQIGESKDVMAAYNRMKGDGRIKLEGGNIVVV